MYQIRLLFTLLILNSQSQGSMPIVWRYLISYYLKIVLACVLAFIGILLTMRLDDIAHFAALGAPLNYLALFVLNQIPYILPIALPLSCLIASLLLIQRLSNTYELTAFRASGFSLSDILSPILVTAAFLSIGNFWMTSEIATRSHLQTNLLKKEFLAVNPLLLLNNRHLMRLKGFYFESLGPSHVGESASNSVLAVSNKHQHRLNLMIAKHLEADPSAFIGEGVTLISGAASEQEEDFDHLLIENIGKSVTQAQDFSNLVQNKVWIVNNDYLQLPLLLARIQEQKQLLEEAQLKGNDKARLKSLKEHLNQSYSEIIKRLSIALAVFSFTFMGTAFGINISRKRHYKTVYLAISLTVVYLVSFFIAKGVGQHYMLATSLYLLPHLLIILVSIAVLRRVTKGIE